MTQHENITLFLEAQTRLGRTKYYKEISVYIEEIRDNCVGGIISSVLHWNPNITFVELMDPHNYLQKHLNASMLSQQGPPVEFVFEDWFL